ncbi:MAG: hypothetical protein IT239_06585 [Bacteroidia bacterium]|nr:hypothetical protein [Bacteroidia bacterium]
MESHFSILDFIVAPIYFMLIFFIAQLYQTKKQKKEPIYKYYKWGIFAKMIGALGLIIIYTQYYKGGDTTNYYHSSKALSNMLFKDFHTFWQIFAYSDMSLENLFAFDESTGYITFDYWGDPKTITVVRLTCLLQLLTFRTYIGTSLLLAFISFIGNWKLFKLFCELYPNYHKQFSYAILFVPSVLFWGSGILKDTYTLSAACWFTYSFYKALIKREKVFWNIIALIITSWIMISIKPYIFIALIPGSLLWLSLQQIKKINNFLFKLIMGPAFAFIVAGTGYILMQTLSDSFGQYSDTDAVLNKAVITQQDLKRDFYQGNSFDIGEFDASIGGVLSKLPEATVAGLFRPFIWEAKNFVMVLAGLENLVLLFLTAFLIVRLGPIPFIKVISNDPMLFFSMLFGVFFAYSVGLTTSNFGAMVRYKIPAVPYYLASILIINERYKALKNENNAVKNLKN